jgi:ATP-dependent protease ClpP protease subunit
MHAKQPRNSTDGDCYGVEPFLLMAKPVGIDYTVNIDEEFIHPKQFAYIVHALENATAYDQFTINLTTPGGALHAVLPLLGAMENTEAHVHVNACSDVASAGTFLLMRADSIGINDYVTIMCHNVSFGSGGSGWNVEKHVEHTLRNSKRLLRDMYKHFLTEDEIEQLLRSTDFYMEKDEFIDRYERRSHLLAEELSVPELTEEDITNADAIEAALLKAFGKEPAQEQPTKAKAPRKKKVVDETQPT